MTKSEKTLENIFSMTRFVETAIAALELKTASSVLFTSYNTVSVNVDYKEIKDIKGCEFNEYKGYKFYHLMFNGIEFCGVEGVES